MARPLLLTGRIELLAAIYNPEILPSAIICFKGKHNEPWCVHSMREGDEDLFEDKLMGRARELAGVDRSNKTKDEEIIFELHRFYEDYPNQSGTCHGCHYNREKNSDVISHLVHETEAVATKTTEDCA